MEEWCGDGSNGINESDGGDERVVIVVGVGPDVILAGDVGKEVFCVSATWRRCSGRW